MSEKKVEQEHLLESGENAEALSDDAQNVEKDAAVAEEEEEDIELKPKKINRCCFPPRRNRCDFRATEAVTSELEKLDN